jgi:hypothetical protein
MLSDRRCFHHGRDRKGIKTRYAEEANGGFMSYRIELKTNPLVGTRHMIKVCLEMDFNTAKRRAKTMAEESGREFIVYLKDNATNQVLDMYVKDTVVIR